MRNGTQEELDAAAEDARLLPYGAKFKLADPHGEWKWSEYYNGEVVFRLDEIMADDDSVSFVKNGSERAIFVGVDMLKVIA